MLTKLLCLTMILLFLVSAYVFAWSLCRMAAWSDRQLDEIERDIENE